MRSVPSVDLTNELLTGHLRTGIEFIGQVESHRSRWRNGSTGEFLPDIIGDRSEPNIAIDPRRGECVLIDEALKLRLRDVAVGLAVCQKAARGPRRSEG